MSRARTSRKCTAARDSVALPLNLAATYRVTVNNFLADGGDGYSVLTRGTNRYVGEIDLDAFARYLEANSPTAPGPQNRITYVP